MDTLRDDYPYAGRMAVEPLDIIVVGAGITGLATALALSKTGHSVTVLECAPNITEVGAGLQLPPNASRILYRLGVLEEVMEHTSVLSGVSIRRYDEDVELGSSPFMPAIGKRYGAPMGVIHRSDLQRILLQAALKNGCQVLTSHLVLTVDPAFRPRILALDYKTGLRKSFCANAVIAADGIRSTLRKQMALSSGSLDQPVPTGDAAYRLLIPRERVKHDSTLLAMLDQNVAMRYLGPGGHVMAYPLRNNSLYNIVLIHPDKRTGHVENEDVWVSQGDRAEMLAFYSSWSPVIRAWIKHADTEVLEWSLQTYKPLRSWVKGSIALAGDACHPMLPYVAQGAANGIEDAAALAVAFTCTADVSIALSVYQVVRKDRAERIAASAAATGRHLHLPDGAEQRVRDEQIRNTTGGSSKDRWRDQQWQDYMWGTDVMRTTIESWDEIVTGLGSSSSPRL